MQILFNPKVYSHFLVNFLLMLNFVGGCLLTGENVTLFRKKNKVFFLTSTYIFLTQFPLTFRSRSDQKIFMNEAFDIDDWE